MYSKHTEWKNNNKRIAEEQQMERWQSSKIHLCKQLTKRIITVDSHKAKNKKKGFAEQDHILL